METELIVRGEGEARVMPDRAIVHVTVDGEGNSREDAYNASAPLTARVDQVVAAHGEAIAHATTAALLVHPKTRWRRGETVRTGWRASRTSVLEVVDFTRLGDLMAELTLAGGAISGPYWQLDAANEVHSQVRRLAAEDARRRADVYAAALGVDLKGISWAAEPGLRLGQPAGMYDGAPRAMMMRGVAAGPEASDVIDVTPDEIVVSATIEVGFGFSGS